MVSVVSILAVDPSSRIGGLVPNPQEISPRRQDLDGLSPKITEQKPSARLAYDGEVHRSFVEFLDPDTGEVMARFPAEDLSKHLDSPTAKDGFSSLETGTLIDSVV